MLAIFLACIAAFIAGFVDAIAGGGGIITFPTLLALNLPVSMVVGTNKLVSSCGTTIATRNYLQNGQINKELARVGIPLVALGALLGAYAVTEVPNEFLKPFTGTMLFCLSVYFFLRPKLGLSSSYSYASLKEFIILGIASFIIGFYDGFFGPGTGMFLSYIMIKYLGLDFIRANGNTRILNLTSNLVSLSFFVLLGKINFIYGIPMAIANTLGGYIGSKYAIKKGSSFVRWIFLFMALVLAVKLLWEGIGF